MVALFMLLNILPRVAVPATDLPCLRARSMVRPRAFAGLRR